MLRIKQPGEWTLEEFEMLGREYPLKPGKVGEIVEGYSSYYTTEQPTVGIIVEFRADYYDTNSGIPTEYRVQWEDGSIGWYSKGALFFAGNWLVREVKKPYRFTDLPWAVVWQNLQEV